MKKLIPVSPLIMLLSTLSGAANAGRVGVPEIDGGMAVIAIGLTVGIVALIREHRRKK